MEIGETFKRKNKKGAETINTCVGKVTTPMKSGFLYYVRADGCVMSAPMRNAKKAATPAQ